MDVDYKLAFDLAPVGLVLSRNRAIVDCNQHLCDMFGASRELLLGQSFQVLYPSAAEYERLGDRMRPILNAQGHYADDRGMKRASGETFWCHVTGRALNRAAPHEAGIWTFEDLGSRRSVTAELTPREAQVLALYASGATAETVAAELFISRNTVTDHVRNIRAKYVGLGRDVRSKTGLYKRAVEDGFVD